MKPKRIENKCLFNSDMNLWNSCEVVNLKTNFRVRDKWNETLNRYDSYSKVYLKQG